MKKILSILLASILATSLFVGCGDSNTAEGSPANGDSAPAASNGTADDASPTADKSTIKLGVLAPLTGTNAEYGKGFQVGMEMAVERINAEGGANGHKLELLISDSKGDAKESSDLARQYIDNDEIYAILGDFTSGSCMANAPIVDAAEIVQLSPTASSADYASMSDFCFSIMGRQDAEAPFFAEYILDKYIGAKSVGLIYINSDWGQSAHDNFMKKADEVGLNVAEVVSYVQDETDFSSLITKLQAADPDVVAILDQGAVPQVINQIRGVGWDVQIAALGPGTSAQLLELSGENAEGLLLTSPFFFAPEDAELMAWRDEFYERAGFEPTIHPACAFDCVYLIKQAIEQIGDGEITRAAIQEQLTGMEMTGVTGLIKFNPDGDIDRQYMICGVENGEYVVREGFDYAY